jgi:hypothetical protein
MKWGEACGFGSPLGYNKQLDEPSLKPHIESTLNCIKMIFNDGKDLKRRYGLRLCQAEHDIVVQGMRGGPSRWKPFPGLKERMPKTQKHLSIRNTVKWAVADKKKFNELVQHLSDLIEDLERLTQDLGIPKRQQILVEYEIESISDISTLENMEASRIGPADRISDAASERLQRLRGSSQR